MQSISKGKTTDNNHYFYTVNQKLIIIILLYTLLAVHVYSNDYEVC